MANGAVRFTFIFEFNGGGSERLLTMTTMV